MLSFNVGVELVMDDVTIAKVKDRYYKKFNDKEKVDKIFPKLVLFRMRGVKTNTVFVEWIDGHVDILRFTDEGFIRVG